MRKLFGILLVLAFMIAGCTGKSAKDAAKEQELIELEMIENDVKAMDSIAAQIDSAKNEIESATQEVDALVNDL